MRRVNLQAEPILQAAADAFGVTRDDIDSTDRHQTVFLARAVAMTLVRELLKMSYPEIGRLFGKDHTTVMSAIRRVDQLLEGGPNREWLVRCFADAKNRSLAIKSSETGAPLFRVRVAND